MSRRPNSSRRRFRSLRLLTLAVLTLARAYAQGKGQAEIVFQGYYLGSNQQALTSTSGIGLHFQDFLPRIGFLSGSLEGYGAQRHLVTGRNFLELRGAPWIGYHWTAAAGDFRAPANLIEFPLLNIFNPEITARGFRVLAEHGGTQYTFFAGAETLTAGPRVPYRVMAPQSVLGAGAARKFGKYLRVSWRFLQFASSPSDIAENPAYFPPGRIQPVVRTLTMQSLYTPRKKLKIYAEVSRPVTSQRAVLSSIAGAAWESKSFTMRMNYVLQGVHYFPLAGYFTGDRQGPYAEVHLHPWKRIDIYASASKYRNNLEKDIAALMLKSMSTSAGISLSLPSKFALSGQVSTIRFTSRQPGDPEIASRNRQISVSLARTIGRHSLHATWRELKLAVLPSAQRQRSMEIEDMYQLRHFFFGGSVRWQRTTGFETRNSVYVRGSLQGHAGRLTAFANVEAGNDLANRTVFATNTYSTTVIGLGVRLARNWNLQAEMFRNHLNMDLNPESIFVLQGGGVPITDSLAALSQWSLYFRLTRQLMWGGGLPSERFDQFAAEAVPLTGVIEGVVKLRGLAGAAFAAGIPVSLDGHRTVSTGPDGWFVFREVPEGEHEVGLALAQLPADFDPGEPSRTRLLVQPRRTLKTEFVVLPLATLQGKVTGPEGAALDAIVIRMHPGDRYTTTGADGRFAFYNVREGDYEIVVDAGTLPERAELQGEGRTTTAVRVGQPLSPVVFAITMKSSEKPVRKVLDRK